MEDEEVAIFLGRLAVVFRSPFKDEETGWREWLVKPYVKFGPAARGLEQMKSKDLPTLPAFKALYHEIHHHERTTALRDRVFPACEKCASSGVVHYVRGGFSATSTRPIHKDRPKNFPYLTDMQVTFCGCEKGQAIFFANHPDGNWGKHVALISSVFSGANLGATAAFIVKCRECEPEDWEDWREVFLGANPLPRGQQERPGDQYQPEIEY